MATTHTLLVLPTQCKAAGKRLLAHAFLIMSHMVVQVRPRVAQTHRFVPARGGQLTELTGGGYSHVMEEDLSRWSFMLLTAVLSFRGVSLSR